MKHFQSRSSEQRVIKATQNWLDSFVIAYNICPFASRERIRNSIRFHVSDTNHTQSTLEALIAECAWLDVHPEIETTLLILPRGFDDFDDYLDMVAVAEHLLEVQNYEGIYQLASFHPHYCFAMNADQSAEDDAANYTNRSPYPMLHIIREESLERALANYPDPENIPARNISLTRELGSQKLQALLTACYE
jgi:hypothetical protein